MTAADRIEQAGLLAAQEDRRDDAAAHLKEAAELAESSAAHGVLRWVGEARKELELR
ncbi:hypothetical protein [Kribbella sp. NPDC023855]|uniref:hypothetical protein n=1 Tax=Kribbella sp. NPDC023855 TaxID=3154698 RepID=UPI0033F02F30